MNYLKIILNWIFLSSKNPDSVSRSLQAATLTFLAAWFPVLQLIHVPVDDATITTVIVSGFAILQAFLVLVGVTVTFVTAFEKVVRTIKGTNVAMGSASPSSTVPTPMIVSQDPLAPVVV